MVVGRICKSSATLRHIMWCQMIHYRKGKGLEHGMYSNHSESMMLQRRQWNEKVVRSQWFRDCSTHQANLAVESYLVPSSLEFIDEEYYAMDTLDGEPNTKSRQLAADSNIGSSVAATRSRESLRTIFSGISQDSSTSKISIRKQSSYSIPIFDGFLKDSKGISMSAGAISSATARQSILGLHHSVSMPEAQPATRKAIPLMKHTSGSLPRISSRELMLRKSSELVDEEIGRAMNKGFR